MGKLYDPNANDPYQDVALIFAGFQCDDCNAYCAGNPDGLSQNPLAGNASQAIAFRWRKWPGNWVGSSISLASRMNFVCWCPSCC